MIGEAGIAAILDPYNPAGSTAHVSFNTTKTDLWKTSPARCHINYAVLDSGWEAEFCRVAEQHPRVHSYVKNHNLWFEVPYQSGPDNRVYRPDFIVRVEDGHGEKDLLNLIVEIKGYRGEDAKLKREAIETLWIEGVNRSGQHGRWAFAEFTSAYAIEEEFTKRVEPQFNAMIDAMIEIAIAPDAGNQQKKERLHG